MNKIMLNTYRWIKDDWTSNPVRFVVELFAWCVSIGCSLTMALTVPNPPLVVLYPVWICFCLLYCWAAFTRKSFGMVSNYLLLITINVIGLTRLLVNHG